MKIYFPVLATLGAVHAFTPVPQGRTPLKALQSAALEAPPLAPLTKWGEKMDDIRKLHADMNSMPPPEFAPEISAKELGLQNPEEQLEYIKANAMALKQKMQDCGAVIFRDFELMKTQDGFQDFYKALGMKVCLDPLHSVSARPTVDGKKNSPVYEAVNKESRKNFFIGEWSSQVSFSMHQIRTPIALMKFVKINLFSNPFTQVCTTNSSERVHLELLRLSALRLPKLAGNF